MNRQKYLEFLTRLMQMQDAILDRNISEEVLNSFNNNVNFYRDVNSLREFIDIDRNDNRSDLTQNNRLAFLLANYENRYLPILRNQNLGSTLQDEFNT